MLKMNDDDTLSEYFFAYSNRYDKKFFCPTSEKVEN